LFSLAEILPLVQFYPEVDISDAEAERLLLAPAKNADDADPFNEDVASALPLSLDRNALRAIDPNHVLILKRQDKHIRNIYYRNILPDLQVTYCSECLLVSLPNIIFRKRYFILFSFVSYFMRRTLSCRFFRRVIVRSVVHLRISCWKTFEYHINLMYNW